MVAKQNRNFLRIAQGINVSPLLIALFRQPELWNQYKVRSWHSRSAARSVDDIILRYNKFNGKLDDYVEAVCSNLAVECYPAWERLPEAVELINSLMFSVRGVELGRVFISRLHPGNSIPIHNDLIKEAEEQFPYRTPPAKYYDRYHIALRSSAGVSFMCGDEQAEMLPGEAWWFNNQIEHCVLNNSADDRLHLVVDIHSPQVAYTPPYAAPEDLPQAEPPK